MKRYPSTEQLEWNRDNDNFDCLRRADILISDFSGVLFDFSLVYDKPLIYADTTFNKGPYDCYWLKEELWTFETLPKIGRQLKEKDLPELKEVIDRCIDDQELQAGRDAARQETWMYMGAGTKNTVDYIVRKYEELSAETEATH